MGKKKQFLPAMAGNGEFIITCKNGWDGVNGIGLTWFNHIIGIIWCQGWEECGIFDAFSLLLGLNLVLDWNSCLKMLFVYTLITWS